LLSKLKSVYKSLTDSICLGFDKQNKKLKSNIMETYKCEKCGMAVNANCATCNEPLVNGTLQLEEGSSVQISQCPKCEGKIKSPQCCGMDMSCSV